MTDATSQGGDSGGPFYHEENSSEVVTAGVVSAGVDFGDDEGNYDDATSGNAIDQIFEELGLRFHAGF